MNQDPKDALLAQYADEIKKLKEQLQGKGSSSGDHTLALDESDLINANRLHEIEEENKRIQSQQDTMKANLKQKADLVEQERQKQAQLAAMLEEYKAQKQKLAEETNQDELIKQAQLDRENMKVHQKERNQQIQQAKKIETSLETGQAAGQIKALHEQYKRLLNKYKSKKYELEDLDKELVEEKFEYLEQAREQNKEIKFLTKVLAEIMIPEDIDKLRHKSKWDDVTNSFDVPGYLMSGAKITIPRMPKKKSKLLFIPSCWGMGYHQRIKRNIVQ